MDISPAPDGSGLLPTLMPVPRPLADHVQRVKKIAAATLEGELAFTRTVLADLRKATEQPRNDVAHMDEDFRKAKAAGASAAELVAITGLQRTARKESEDQFQAGVQKVLAPVRERLQETERAAMRELEERPGIQPTPADYTMATELASTLDLLPPLIAAQVLAPRLVIEPAKSGKGLGLTAAMVPLLRGRMSDPKWEACREFRDLLTQAQIVTRDAGYYKAHQALAAVASLRLMQASLVTGYRNPEAAEQSPAYLQFGAKPVARYVGAPTFRDGVRVA